MASRLVKIAAWVAGVIALLVLAALAGIQTSWFQNFAREQIEKASEEVLRGHLRIGRLHGSLLRGVQLDDVTLHVDGRDVLVAPAIALHYSLGHLLGRSLTIERVTLVRPTVTLVETDAGWNVASLVQPRETETGSTPRGVTIETLDVDDGQLVIDRVHKITDSPVRVPSRIEHVEAQLSLSYDAPSLRLLLKHVSFLSSDPSLVVHNLSGDLHQEGDAFRVDGFHVQTDRSDIRLDGEFNRADPPHRLDVRLEGAPVDVEEWSGILPSLSRSHIAPTLKVEARGPLNAVSVKASAHDQRAGAVALDLVLDAASTELRVKGAVHAKRLNLQPATGDDRLLSSINASIQLDAVAPSDGAVESIHGTVSMSGDELRLAGYQAKHFEAAGAIANGRSSIDVKLEAYGAATTGRVILTRKQNTTSYDARGRLVGLDLRRLPGQLGVPKLESHLGFQYEIAGIDDSARARLRFDPSLLEGMEIANEATARFATGGRPSYGFDGSVAHLNLRRIGRALGVNALDDDRLDGDISGSFEIEGAGTSLPELDLRANGRLDPSRMFDADVQRLNVVASLAEERLEVTTQGRVQGLRLERLGIDERASGALNAEFDVAGSLDNVNETPTPDSFRGTVRAIVDDAKPFGVAIDRADLSLSYGDRITLVDSLHVSSEALDIEAAGSLSLGEKDSDLKYKAQILDLEGLEPLVGHSLAGSVSLEGRVTGSRDRLTISGPVSMTRFRYEDIVDALTSKGTYEVSVPDLDVRQASVSATLDSSLLVLQGRELTSASATVTYQQPELTFDARLRSGERTAVARGHASISPEAQQVQIQQVALGNEKTIWNNAADQPLNIDYRGGAATFDHLRLSSGSQVITVNGTLPLAGDTAGNLEVEASDVDLEALTDLFLLDKKLKGRLNASATVGGFASSREVDGEFEIRGGAIDQLTYESLKGQAGYVDQSAKVDVTLIEKPGAELTVIGTVPFMDEQAGQPAAVGIDVRVKSSPVSLSIVQAVTSQLTDVAGTLALNLQVQGNLKTPRLYGELTVADGAMRVVPSGARYRKLNTQLVFEGPTARIDRLSVEDNDGHSLAATVQIGLAGRSVNTVDMAAQASDFKVLDNEMGRVSLDGKLTLQGSLDKPRVDGSLKIASGRIEVDALLEKLTSNPYQTTPESIESTAEKPAGPLDNLELAVSLQVPNNLVLRGSDVRSGDGPALGDINITVGGTLDVRKSVGTEATITGAVTTVRGTYNFQGRRFAVQRDGRIEFRGGQPVDPALDLAADREVSGVIAHVEIGGTSRRPTLKLSSDPPMEETDILSLIVFNQPANQLGEGERISLSERAAAMAGGAVVGAITESLGKALNLSMLEVETVGEAGGAPMVTVGKQVGSRLFVRLRQLFGAQEVSELQLEYELTNYLRLQGSVSDGQGLTNRSFIRRVERGGADIVVFLRY
jgi:autotransporter translocation and assembly factor TamB